MSNFLIRGCTEDFGRWCLSVVTAQDSWTQILVHLVAVYSLKVSIRTNTSNCTLLLIVFEKQELIKQLMPFCL